MTVLELFSNESAWTKGCLARDKYKNASSAISSKATCFCLLGGVYRAYPDASPEFRAEIFNKIYSAIRTVFPNQNPGITSNKELIVVFNDQSDTTYQMVMKVLQVAQV